MVPLNFNLNSYKDYLKYSIIQRKASLEAFKYPLDWAWLTYAISQDGTDNNPIFIDSLASLINWAFSELPWTQERSLAALGLCAYFMPKDERYNWLMANIMSKLENLMQKEASKFSALNDPEQVFCIVLGTKDKLNSSQRAKLLRLSLRNQELGRPLRRALYTAAALELGKGTNIWPTLTPQEITPDDVISVLWLSERYKEKVKTDISLLWKIFENTKDSFSLETASAENQNMMTLRSLTIGMLYEALSIETRKPDIDMLFDMYPLHPRVREISEADFKSKSYVPAVEQATRVLTEIIQKKSGVHNKSEVRLVQATMEAVNQPSTLKIKFNKFLQEQSGKDEQLGLARISEGVFKAFRHPKGHKPKDHPLIELDAYEALDQLVTISFLMKRIEEAD